MTETENIPYTMRAILWGRGEMKTKIQACLSEQMRLAVLQGCADKARVIWDMCRIIDGLDLSFGDGDND